MDRARVGPPRWPRIDLWFEGLGCTSTWFEGLGCIRTWFEGLGCTRTSNPQEWAWDMVLSQLRMGADAGTAAGGPSQGTQLRRGREKNTRNLVPARQLFLNYRAVEALVQRAFAAHMSPDRLALLAGVPPPRPPATVA